MQALNLSKTFYNKGVLLHNKHEYATAIEWLKLVLDIPAPLRSHSNCCVSEHVDA